MCSCVSPSDIKNHTSTNHQDSTETVLNYATQLFLNPAASLRTNKIYCGTDFCGLDTTLLGEML